ncbi:site-specific integrase [Blautia sp. JLR.GB0024]|uniref:tyrosine-type recombinase/integrase n=1 Tax=Blautia sp. JLR.GB0024 TaxID=3123295 RepID=UPI003004B223
MGELRTRKRGKYWEYSFEGAKIDGKRNPISKSGFRTKADAIAAGTQAKAEYDNTGRSFTPSDVSVADYLDYWYENYVLKHLAYRTQCDYESKIRLHLKPAFGKYRLSALEPDAIQRWIDGMKEKGYSKNMLKNSLACLSGALNYAILPCKYIKSNPCDHVKIAKVTQPPERKAKTEYICVQEDFDKIVNRFGPGSIFYIPLMVAYHLGTRLGESYGFDLLRDVNFEKHTISINYQMQKEGKTWFLRPPKYDSYRTIGMDPFIESILKQEIVNRKKHMMLYGEYFMKTYVSKDDSLFQAPASTEIVGKEIMPVCARENGELLTPESFKYCVRVVHNELCNPLFHHHCLRHTHGTILAENGANPKAVMERLGHKDIKTTFNRYIFATDKMKDDAVRIFTEATNNLPTI